MAGLLKLIALDTTDLTVISAHVQDALVNTGEVKFDGNLQQMAVPLRRFVWEAPEARRWLFPKKERRLSLLHFNRVLAVRSKGIDLASKSETLVLLSVRFEPPSAVGDPSGVISLVFAGDAQISLDVECIEAQIADTGAAWAASSRPRHKGEGEETKP